MLKQQQQQLQLVCSCGGHAEGLALRRVGIRGKANEQETCIVQVPEGGVAWGGHQPNRTQLLPDPGLHSHNTATNSASGNTEM